MSIRTSVVLLVLFLSLSTIYSAEGKNNKKQQLPNYVLEAHRVLVVIRPDAGEPVTNPTANRNAEEAVESAISKWGRFTLVMDAQAADLIIAVRKGQAGGPVIGNSPIDNRTVIFQPNDGGVRVGWPARPFSRFDQSWNWNRRIEGRASAVRSVRPTISLKFTGQAPSIHWMPQPFGDIALRTR